VSRASLPYWCNRGSHSTFVELFPEYALLQQGTASPEFSWIGPDIRISERDERHPLSSDPMDLQLNPVYHESWEDEEKSSDDEPEDETSKQAGPDSDSEHEKGEDEADPAGVHDMDVEKPDEETPDHEDKQEEPSGLRVVQASPDGMRSKLRKRVRRKQDESNIAGMFCHLVNY
jgi:hypothetical protein